MMEGQKKLWWPILLVGLALLPRSGWSSGPEHPAKVVVIGLDGVSLNLLEPFTEKGITPHRFRQSQNQGRKRWDIVLSGFMSDTTWW